MPNSIIIFVVLIQSILVQKDTKQKDNTQKDINKLDSIFVSNYNSIYSYDSPLKSNEFVTFLSNISVANEFDNSLTKDLLLAKQDLYRSDLGLSFNSNYMDNQLSNAFELEENSTFKRRIISSLQWDVLNNGYIENKNKAKALDYDLKINDYKISNESNKSLYLKRFNQTIVVFNAHKMNIINDRKSILNQLYEIENNLYFDKQINKEELLETQLRNAEIEGLTKVYGTYNELSNLEANAYLNKISSIPVFDLNYRLLLKDFEGENFDSISNFLAKDSEILSKWYNKIGLSVFTRHTYFQNSDNVDLFYSSFVSLGLNLRVPLNFSSSAEKKLNQIEVNQKINNLKNQKLVYQEELLNDLYEFRYKLKQYISFYYKQQKVKDLIRIEEVKRKLNSANFSPIKGLKYIDEFLQIELELVDLKQNLYLKLLRVHDKVPSMSLDSLIVPFDFKLVSMAEKNNFKSVYVWTSIFKDYDLNFLIEYINYNNFNQVILAANENDLSQNDKIEFVNKLFKNNVQISLMIGQNNFLNEKNISLKLYKTFLGYDLTKVKSIHLDVEPHTFKSWKTEKDQLLSDYLKMLNEVAIFCKSSNLKLEVSIPLNYPEEVTKSILSTVDQVHFMCYENIDSNYIERKIAPYISNKDKYTIALRTEDFKGRNDMEEYSQLLNKKFKTNKITYHDLKRLLLIDEEEKEK